MRSVCVPAQGAGGRGAPPARRSHTPISRCAPPPHAPSLPGDFGFDPLGLGANADTLKWFAEAERVHCRWAMLGVAGILGQEVVHPEQFWYMQVRPAAGGGGARARARARRQAARVPRAPGTPRRRLGRRAAAPAWVQPIPHAHAHSSPPSRTTHTTPYPRTRS